MRLCIFARGMAGHRAGYVWPFDLLAPMFAARGRSVTVLTTAAPDGATRAAPAEGVEVLHLTGTTPAKCDARFFAASAAAFDALHAEAPFDVVLGRSASPFGIYGRAGADRLPPLVLHEGTSPAWLHRVEVHGSALARLAVPVRAVWEARRGRETALCLRRAARVVCVGAPLAAALRRSRWWRPPATTAIPYAFDVATFAPKPARPLSHGGAPCIVYAGRLSETKGAGRLLDILGLLERSDARLEAIGPSDPAYLARLVAQAEARGVADRVTFPGALSHVDLAARLAEADAFLFPSTHPEGASKTVTEAMAAGLPVVAYALPGVCGQISDGVDGALVPAGRADLAAARLDAILADPSMAQRLGTAARDRVRRLSDPEQVAAAWDAVLDAAVSGARG